MTTRRALQLMAVALLAGAILRFAYPSVIVFLGDERWTLDHVTAARGGGSWGTLGMPASNGVRNGGMSVWAFILLSFASGGTTPEGLTRAVAALGLLAIAAGFVIPLRLARTDAERAAWAWGLALTATNPIIVFLERKIWAQSVLPIFNVALFAAWMRRETRAGSFVWGLLGAIVGQIHMAGFFFAPALAAFTALFDRQRRARWWAWFAGSVAGGLPAVPWLLYLAREHPQPHAGSPWLRFRLEFYQYFFSDPTALGTSYVLGDDVARSLAYPRIAGHPTYLTGAAFVALAVASLAIGVRALRHAWSVRRDLARWALDDRSDTAIAIAAVLLGEGVLMTLPSISIYRHYIMAAVPLPYVWTARAALRAPGGERWLRVLFAGALVVSIGTLAFLVDNDGADEFGKSWGAQLRDGTPPDEAKRFRAAPR